MRLSLRIASALVGVAAAVVAFLLAFQVVLDQIQTTSAYPRHPQYWSIIGLWFFVFSLTTFLVSLSYLCFRFAAGSRNLNEAAAATKLFVSLAVGSTSVIAVSILSQAILLVVAAIRVRYLPKAVREFVRVGWQPSDWQATRSSPYFALIGLVLFASAFYWTHRRAD